MKILASDFDGTLSRDGGISASDLAAIERFRRAGNKFGLVTGRSYILIQPEFARNPGFKCDFLVLSTGGAVADEKGELIFERIIEKPTVLRLIERLYELDAMHFGCSDRYGNHIFRLADDLNNDEFLGAVGPLDPTPDAILERGRVEAFVVYDSDSDRSAKIMAILEKEFEGEASFHFNDGSIDITPFGASKSAGIAFIEEYYGAKANVIGDERNDLGMLIDYESFAVDTGCAEALAAADRVVGSVGEAIAILMGEDK